MVAILLQPVATNLPVCENVGMLQVARCCTQIVADCEQVERTNAWNWDPIAKIYCNLQWLKFYKQCWWYDPVSKSRSNCDIKHPLHREKRTTKFTANTLRYTVHLFHSVHRPSPTCFQPPFNPVQSFPQPSSHPWQLFKMHATVSHTDLVLGEGKSCREQISRSVRVTKHHWQRRMAIVFGDADGAGNLAPILALTACSISILTLQYRCVIHPPGYEDCCWSSLVLSRR